MSTKCIFHVGDRVNFLDRAKRECVSAVRELVRELQLLPYVTIAEIDAFYVDGYVRIEEDDKVHYWPEYWFELLAESQTVPIDDLI